MKLKYSEYIKLIKIDEERSSLQNNNMNDSHYIFEEMNNYGTKSRPHFTPRFKWF